MGNGFLEIIIIAIGLAMDAFSVSISAGMAVKKPDAGHYFRLSFHFGLFQFLMPVIGYFAGVYIERYIRDYDHWLAFTLLVFIGVRMIYAALFGDEESVQIEERDPSRGWSLVVLSVATSIDALAVGLSLGVLGRAIFVPSVIIGVTCALFSLAGVYIGRRAGALVGRRAEALGGAMLVLIGLKILADHMGWW
ncbi:MAG: manganese efflux pump [Spirochaetes bacterium]|nr:manganese efflux pump [Spirochaetota bacterium]